MGKNNGPLFVYNESPRYGRVVVDVETVATVAPYIDAEGNERWAAYAMGGDGRPCMTKATVQEIAAWCRSEFR